MDYPSEIMVDGSLSIIIRIDNEPDPILVNNELKRNPSNT